MASQRTHGGELVVVFYVPANTKERKKRGQLDKKEVSAGDEKRIVKILFCSTGCVCVTRHLFTFLV